MEQSTRQAQLQNIQHWVDVVDDGKQIHRKWATLMNNRTEELDDNDLLMGNYCV